MPITTAFPSDGVAVLTLDNPKLRNALTADARAELRDTLETLSSDMSVKAVVITGAGGHFCAGGDVRTMGETDLDVIDERMGDVAKTATLIAQFPKPLIAAVSGHAAGAGVSLACLCDLVVADESAQFTFSFLRLALGPDWGLSFTLAQRIGATKAKGLILSRGSIDGVEAHRIGLVDTLSEDGKALETAIDQADRFNDGPVEATKAVKSMLQDIDGLKAALEAEAKMQRTRFPAWEHQEGAKAFSEKRSPDYTKKPD
jgi:2-(1,2-epoxy-1,2-dihydrophenyl)acetyl-CoA isomerase